MSEEPIRTPAEALEAAARAVGDLRGRDLPRRDAEDAGEGYDLAIDEAQAAIRALASRIPEPREDDVLCTWPSCGHTGKGQCRAALSAMRPAPEGWRLVPVEPTPEMIRAAMTAFVERKDVAKHGADKAITRAEWAAMLAAAPAHGGRDE